MSVFATAAHTLAALAASAGIPALIFIMWAGILYHRALSLPDDKREHGLRVLAQLTALLRALRGPRKPKALTGLLRHALTPGRSWPGVRARLGGGSGSSPGPGAR